VLEQGLSSGSRIEDYAILGDISWQCFKPDSLLKIFLWPRFYQTTLSSIPKPSSPIQTCRAEEGEPAGLFDLDVENLAGEAGGVAVEDDNLVLQGAAC